MKCTIKLITPDLARSILRNNLSNRKLSKKKVEDYARLMKNGMWEENGESIVINEDGVLTNGQHRLHAVIKSNHSYMAVLVTDVKSSKKVMSTFDTGKTRTASDVLSLNGYKNTNQIASIVSAIMANNINSDQLLRSGVSMRSTNYEVLKYYEDNKEYIDKLLSDSLKIHVKQTVRVLSLTRVAFYINFLSDGNYDDIHLEFMKYICGVIVEESSSASWVFKILLNAKNNKTKLSDKYITIAIIKAWNNFLNGNPSVTYLRIDIKGDIPTPQKITKNRLFAV